MSAFLSNRELEALRNSASDCHRTGKLDRARAQYCRYLAQRPKDAGIWSNYGALMRAEGAFDKAVWAQEKAYELKPDDQGLRNNYANILNDIGRHEESIKLRNGLLEETPDDPMQKAMIGKSLRGLGRQKQAIEFLSNALKTHPDDAELNVQTAFAHFSLGQFREGFKHYQFRWGLEESNPRKMRIPQWQGEDLQGKTVLVLPEQGFGDFVLFSRFLSLLKQRGATVFLEVKKPLLRLFQALETADKIAVGFEGEPGIDVWMNIMDLAQAHFEEAENIPDATTLYIPDDSKIRAAAIVAPHLDKVKIGVIWSGSVTYKGNAFRSFSHSQFLPLTRLPGVQLFSLYKGPFLEPFQADGSAGFIIDTASSDRDFADAAAAMQQMDLIITADTATAHIAGSLGLPTWLVLHWDAFWFWKHEGENTPWYPSVRLFRQKYPMDWDEVFSRVEAELCVKFELETTK